MGHVGRPVRRPERFQASYNEVCVPRTIAVKAALKHLPRLAAPIDALQDLGCFANEVWSMSIFHLDLGRSTAGDLARLHRELRFLALLICPDLIRLACRDLGTKATVFHKQTKLGHHITLRPGHKHGRTCVTAITGLWQGV